MSQSTVNKVILMGSICKEPRIHIDHDGEKVLCFNIVTVENLKRAPDEQWHEETHTIRINESLLNTVKLQKGMTVYVQGKLQTKAFVDEANVRRYKTSIMAYSVDPVGVEQLADQVSF